MGLTKLSCLVAKLFIQLWGHTRVTDQQLKARISLSFLQDDFPQFLSISLSFAKEKFPLCLTLPCISPGHFAVPTAEKCTNTPWQVGALILAPIFANDLQLLPGSMGNNFHLILFHKSWENYWVSICIQILLESNWIFVFHQNDHIWLRCNIIQPTFLLRAVTSLLTDRNCSGAPWCSMWWALWLLL